MKVNGDQVLQSAYSFSENRKIYGFEKHDDIMNYPFNPFAVFSLVSPLTHPLSLPQIT